MNLLAFASIDENKNALLENFRNTSDLILYDFVTDNNIKVLLCYIDNFIDRNTLDRDVIEPIVTKLENVKDIKKVLYVSSIKELNDFNEIIDLILYGSVAIFLEGMNNAFVFDLKSWEKRSIEEPPSEGVIRGPKEGFVEDIDVNRVLIRKKIKKSSLVFEDYKLGRITETKISICYIDGIANERVLDEVKDRILHIDTDSILDSGYVEQFIEDSPKSIFSTIGDTQKPDVVAGRLLEGRVAVLCDGSPHVLTIPQLFIENIQASEDYYNRPFLASFFRFIRSFSLFISIILPGFYVALQTFHQEMIPTVLLITMAGAREGVPLPAVLEALIMTLALEVIKESGIRLPRAIGSAVSIVGALVLGQAAVQAGIISAPMVMVIAVTAIGEFTVPSLSEAITIYRIILILLGGFMGLYGITCGLTIMIIHLLSLKSFGIDYASPISPLNKEGLKDFVIRFPLRSMKKRPKEIENKNIIRRGDIGKK